MRSVEKARAAARHVSGTRVAAVALLVVTPVAVLSVAVLLADAAHKGASHRV